MLGNQNFKMSCKFGRGGKNNKTCFYFLKLFEKRVQHVKSNSQEDVEV